ncbi:alpha/beta hydrolase [Nonomuraea sp. FMUSA5-5]|uniref:Alpha/beta hydrolase n=1 Tax=Nonomuraea composti TaxID=2720023 RepID=A0ABX1AZ65_9ACTN|nr:alpha/beta hydrolase [Nonomuraea sp. FMUSA5-5]
MTDQHTADLPPIGEILAALEAAPPQDDSGGYSTDRLIELEAELAALEVRDFTISAPAGPIPARGYRSQDHAPVSALVWVHGGAFVGGSLDMPEAHWVGLSLAARGIPVLSVDYHKALHGVTFPIPSDDIRAAWTWALEHREELGFADIAVQSRGRERGRQPHRRGREAAVHGEAGRAGFASPRLPPRACGAAASLRRSAPGPAGTRHGVRGARRLDPGGHRALRGRGECGGRDRVRRQRSGARRTSGDLHLQRRRRRAEGIGRGVCDQARTGRGRCDGGNTARIDARLPQRTRVRCRAGRRRSAGAVAEAGRR